MPRRKRKTFVSTTDVIQTEQSPSSSNKTSNVPIIESTEIKTFKWPSHPGKQSIEQTSNKALDSFRSSQSKSCSSGLNHYGPISVLTNLFEQNIRLRQIERHDVTITLIENGKGNRGARGKSLSSWSKGRSGSESVKSRQPSEPNLPKTVKRETCREVMLLALCNRSFWCYDDQKTLVSYQKINFRSSVEYKRKQYDVCVTWQDTFHFNYDTFEKSQESDHLLNIVWREASIVKNDHIGAYGYFPQVVEKFHLFGERDGFALQGKALRFGFSQVSQFIKSSRNDSLSPVICINVKGSIGILSQPLADYIENVTQLPLSKLLKPSERTLQTLKRIKGLKIELNHFVNSRTGKKESRTKKIDSIDTRVTARSFSFQDQSGRRVSVEDYFRSVYNIKLKHANDWPLVCLNFHKKTYVPLELCELKLQQDPTVTTLDPKVCTAVNNRMVMNPKERRDLIEHFARTAYQDNPILNHYGITASTEMRSVQAVVLSPPRVLYHDNETAEVESGFWGLSSQQFILPKDLLRWVLAYYPTDNERTNIKLTSKTQLDPVIKEMKESAHRLGMGFTDPVKVVQFITDSRDEPSRSNPQEELFKSITILHDKVKKKLPDCQLVVVVIPKEKLDEIRPLIKLHFERWIPTSHLVIQNTPILNGKLTGVRQHFNNVMSKINLKLAGDCHSTERIPDDLNDSSIDALRQILNHDCLVLGADVCKPGLSYLPSIVGVVASINGMKEWRTALRAQPKKTEIITDFRGILRQIYAGHKVWLNNILYVRDGVSESEHEKVLDVEVKDIERAYAEEGFQKPRITVIIAAKRIRTRFFPKEPNDPRVNVPPGLVVMEELLSSDSRYENFYMVSHAGIKGTSNPCRYFIIKDDLCQDLRVTKYFWPYACYDMCFRYQRCQGSVSYPAPTYYSHLLADRGRLLVDDIARRYHDVGTVSDSSYQKAKYQQLKKLSETEEKTMLASMNERFRIVCENQGFRMFFT